MNKYKAFLGSKSKVLEADNSYEATRFAAYLFQKDNPRRKIKTHNVTVMLLSDENGDVIHSPDF